MERPDIGKPFAGPGKRWQLVATTQDPTAANQAAERYEEQGYETRIRKKKQGSLSVFEVWVAKEPEILGGGSRRIGAELSLQERVQD